MRVLVVVLAALTHVGTANSYLTRPNLRLLPGCRDLTIAGVRCVSKTQFVMSFQDANKDQPTECPRGAVCADIEEICSSSEPAVCETVPPPAEIKGVCNTCPIEPEYNPVCVSDTDYAFCAEEKIQNGMRYKCPASKPYCKAEFHPNHTLKSICTAEKTGTDCPLKPGTSFGGSPSYSPGISSVPGHGNTAVAPGAPSECTADGWYADFSDMTCRSYYRCLAASGGKFIKVDFKCVTMNAVYHPDEKRCVSDGSFICPT